MKYLFLLLSLLGIVIISNGQNNPTGFPTQKNVGWQEWGWSQSDSGTIIATRDTSFVPRFCGTIILWKHAGIDTAYWFWNCKQWIKLTSGNIPDTTSLSNRINLKLNISDTASMLLPYFRKADTINLWVQNVYSRNDSLFRFKNGAETFIHTFATSGSGTVTSVGLSMPAAFTVSGSPVTGSGTLSVSGAGTSLEYIKGNGTLGTTDTGMIPNFYLKVRGLLSGTSPVTYNSATGAIGINNANTSGTKGAATFNSGSFSDNGSGTISLLDVISNGSCLNCQLTYDSKGRIVSASNGVITPPPINAPGAGDTLMIADDTIKRLNPGFGMIHTVTQYSITESVDTTKIATQYDLTLVNNGLSRSVDTTQLGGSLVKNTTIDGGGNYSTTFTSSRTGTNNTVLINNTSSGYGLSVTASGSGVGADISSTSGYGANIHSNTGPALQAFSGSNTSLILQSTSGNLFTGIVQPSSTNTIISLGDFYRKSTGTAANGMGGSIEFYNTTSAGFDDTAARISYSWTNATNGSQTSVLNFATTNNTLLENKFQISGNGQITLNKYGVSTFQTVDTSFNTLVVDGSGNIFKRSGGGSSGGGGSTLLNYKNVGFGGIGNTLSSGESQFQYDSIKNELFVDSINLINARINEDAFNADSIVFFGTSITVGVGQTSGNNYSTILTNRLNSLESNHGISGAKLLTEGIANIWEIPNFSRAKYRWLILEWGTNDVSQAGTDSTAFDTIYRKYVDTAIIARGWPANRIVILAPGYILPTISGGVPTLSKQAQFREATLSISLAKGTKWVDIYSAEIFRNTHNILNGDGIHPNDYGAGIYVSNIYNTIGDSVMSTNQNISVNGYVEFQRLKLRNNDTANYKGVVAGLDSVGNLVRYTKDQIIQNSTTLPTPQGASISLVGKGNFGNITAPDTVSIVQVNGGIVGTSLGVSGSVATGATGSKLWFAYALDEGYIYAQDATNNIQKNVNIAPFGGNVRIGGSSTSAEKLYVNGGFKASFAQFTSSLPGGLTGAGIELGNVGGSGYVGAFDRSTSTALPMTVQLIGGNVMIGSNTDNGEKLQVNGTTRLTGLLNYRGATIPPSTFNILVHGLTDSIVYQIPMSTNLIPGTNTNDNAPTGYLGENIESYTSTYTNYTTSATYQAIDSITLTAGDWDISAQSSFSSNGATITSANDAIFVISTTRASSSGATEGKNIAYVPQAALLGTNHESISISPFRVSLSSTTKYYLNTQATFTVGNPQYVGGIRARRMR